MPAVLDNQGTPSPRPLCYLCLLEITSWLVSWLREEDQKRTAQKLPSPVPPTPGRQFSCHGFVEAARELEGSFMHLPIGLKNSWFIAFPSITSPGCFP